MMTRAMATKPTGIRTVTVRHSGAITGTPYAHKPLDHQIAAALAALERDGYELVDIRYAVAHEGDGHTEQHAMVIGRKKEG